MKKRSYFQSLRGKITNRILFIGIVPILVIGSITWFSFNQLTTEVSSKLNLAQAEMLDRVVGANLISVSCLSNLIVYLFSSGSNGSFVLIH
jgi:hypothetical protein